MSLTPYFSVPVLSPVGFRRPRCSQGKMSSNVLNQILLVLTCKRVRFSMLQFYLTIHAALFQSVAGQPSGKHVILLHCRNITIGNEESAREEYGSGGNEHVEMDVWT